MNQREYPQRMDKFSYFISSLWHFFANFVTKEAIFGRCNTFHWTSLPLCGFFTRVDSQVIGDLGLWTVHTGMSAEVHIWMKTEDTSTKWSEWSVTVSGGMVEIDLEVNYWIDFSDVEICEIFLSSWLSTLLWLPFFLAHSGLLFTFSVSHQSYWRFNYY